MTTSSPKMILSLLSPIILGLDRLETASLLGSAVTFQYLTGLPSYLHPESLRRLLLQADPDFREQLHRVNDYLLQRFIHQPEHRSRLILDLDSMVLTVFGHQEGAVGYRGPGGKPVALFGSELLVLVGCGTAAWRCRNLGGQRGTLGLLFSLHARDYGMLDLRPNLKENSRIHAGFSLCT